MKKSHLVLLFIVLLTSNALAIDREKYKSLKARQQKVVLEQAKAAATEWRFGQAKELLERAGNMNYSPEKIQAVEQLIAAERSKQAEQKRRQRDTERQRITASQQKQRKSRTPTDSSGSCSKLVNIEFDGPGAEHNASVGMWIPSGCYILNGKGTSNVSVGIDSGCIGGGYTFNYTNNTSWTGGSEQRSYSGSFSVPSSASYCFVSISEGFTGSSVNVSCD